MSAAPWEAGLDLRSIVTRGEIEPWSGEHKIPWDDPDFSRRMLAQHLDQDHPGASRPFEEIERHVDWIERTLLPGRAAARVLDLCCGPGLYAVRLAERGHRCRGIDFSPASIDYARRLAQERGLDCVLELGDVRSSPLGSGHDLALLTYGELNTFPPDEVPSLLERMAGALERGGRLAVEVHDWDDVRRVGQLPPLWYAEESGLFGDEPYICLRENRWFEEAGVAVSRYFVIDAGSGEIQQYCNTLQGYRDETYVELLMASGVGEIEQFDSLEGTEREPGGLRVYVGTKP